MYPHRPTPPLFPEIAVALARSGRTITSLANEVGVSSGHLASCIRGRFRPSPQLAQRVADALNAPVDVVWAERTEGPGR